MLTRVLAIVLFAFVLLLAPPAFTEATFSEFLGSVGGLHADFVQHNPNGSKSTGKIFLSVPHKLRIDYPKEGISILLNKGMLTYSDANLKESRKFFLGRSDPLLAMISSLRDPKQYKRSKNSTLLYLERSANKKKYTLVLTGSPAEIKEILFENDLGQVTRMVLNNIVYNVVFDKNTFTKLE